MPFYRGTLLFQRNLSPPCGFSESFEFQRASDSGAASVVRSWPALRSRWLSSDWKIVGSRLASVTTTFVSPSTCKRKYTPVSVEACTLDLAGLLGPADSPYTCVYVAFDRLSTGRKRVYFARGIPDTWWTGGVLSIPNADGNAFLQWFTAMKSETKFGTLTATAPGCSLANDVYTAYCVKRIASRRIGRPFVLLRGRRSVPTL